MKMGEEETFRQFDWAATPLGPIETWSRALRRAAGLDGGEGIDEQAVQEFVLRLSDALRPLHDPVEIQRTAARMLGERLSADRAFYTLLNWNRRVGLVERDYVRGEVPSLVGEHRFEHFGSVIDAYAEGRVLAIDDIRDPVSAPAADLSAFEALAIRAFITAPLVKDGVTVGAMSVLRAEPHAWSETDRALVVRTAERTWAAVEQARAEAALHDSEARYRGLLNAANQVLYRMNADWSQMEQLSGGGFLADTSEPDPDWFDAYIHPEDQPQVRAAIDEAIRTKTVFEMEHRVVRADGTLGWTLSRSIPILDEAGEIVEWFGAASDVTNRREVQERLRQYAQSVDELILESPFGIYVVDADFRVVHASRSARQSFGADFLLGMDLAEALRRLWNEPFASEAIDLFRHTLVSGRSFRSTQTIEQRADRSQIEAYDWRLERIAMPDGRHGVVCYYYDLSERIRMEEALRQSEERLRMASAIAHVATWDWNIRGGEVTWSEEHYPMQGYRPGEVKPSYEAWLERVHPDDRTAASDALADAVASRSRYRHAFRVRHPDDTIRIMSAQGQCFYDDAGDPTRMIGVMRDVTEETEAVAALAESEARFRQFAENSADTIRILDAHTGTYEFLSPAFETMWGESRERILTGRTDWIELAHPEDREIVRQMLSRILAGETCIRTYRIVRPDTSEIRWIRDTGFPIMDDGGTIVRVGGISQDLTSRIRNEQAVRENRRVLAALVQGIPQIVWRAVKGGEINWMSRQWSEYSGQADGDGLGSGWTDVVHPDDREPVAEAWTRADGTGEIDRRLRLRGGDGRYRWFQMRSLAVRDDDGRLIEWLGTFTDIDDLQRMQEQQEVMVAELQHRTRNLLGVVRALASETVKTSVGLEDFASRFNDRLSALSRVQGLLSRSQAKPVLLGDLVAAELGALGSDASADRTVIEGPAVALPPRMVQTLALAIHELATNARKYGALASDLGRLSVRWHVEGSQSDGSTLHVEWRERGARFVGAEHSAKGRGYGRKLIEKALPYSLGARTDYAIDGDGVRCIIDLPLEMKEPGDP